MNKKAMGTVGKVFSVIGIIILLIISFIGITAYQGYTLAKTIEQKAPELQANIEAALLGDCDKIEDVNGDIDEILDQIRSACKNPALKAAIEGMGEETGYNCNNLDEAEEEFRSSLDEAKQACN